MSAVQHHVIGRMVAAWRRRDDAPTITTLREPADARFTFDASRGEVRSTFVAPR